MSYAEEFTKAFVKADIQCAEDMAGFVRDYFKNNGQVYKTFRHRLDKSFLVIFLKDKSSLTFTWNKVASGIILGDISKWAKNNPQYYEVELNE